MRSSNYGTLLEGRYEGRAERIAAARSLPIREAYRNGNGVQCVTADGSGRYFQEVVRISKDALLISTNSVQNVESVARQVVTDGDWVHVQLRFSGKGSESFTDVGEIETPEKSCIVARYPENAVVERRTLSGERWKYLCLFMTPEAVRGLLDASAADLPPGIAWIAEQGHLDLQFDIRPLDGAMALAASEIYACPLAGSARRAYLRAKSIELLSALLRDPQGPSPVSTDGGKKLSPLDIARLSLARSFMTENMAGGWSLADLAHRVGLNRSKLAFGFKQIYGVSVRQFWREVNLDKARGLLQDGSMSVTELAFDMGYADPYSFTRAFHRKFGSPPNEWKR
jgi:AraC family transcriptional regulator, transcriptional activator of the genes for pyochelin and ferripyochelin receptors